MAIVTGGSSGIGAAIARAIAAADADFVTAQTLFVCGGASVGSLGV